MLSIETTQSVLPTYQRGPDSPWLPLSFGGRLRQRTVWPYHAQDDIDIATMRRDDTCRHTAVRLSNGLLEAIVLPGMNGRLYSLRDLRSGRELFYRNHVVKPALVALRGAWLSGGVEFNFPTLGHTVSTVSPVFHRCIEGPREVAVVVGDIDRSTGQRWQVRMGLREGRAALDVDLTLANPNPWRERLYYWENAAVPAAADMRFVCRCDWTVGTPSLPFPMRDGIDRSLHVNNPTPLDHFGYRSHADVFGAYYSDRRLGTYHVAPRISLPGQKYFTWGTHEDNRIWERFLTDDDGQYVEIQAGLLESQWFSDWLQPQEVARAHGSWFGTADMNELTWSTENLAVAAAVIDDSLSVEVHSLDLTGRAVVALVQDDHSRRQSLEMAPGEVSRAVFPTTAPGWIEIRDRQGRLRFRRRWYGPETQSLDPQRDRRPPTQWCLRARRDTAVGQATVAAQYHRWHEARERLQADAPPLLALDRVLLLAEVDLKTGQPQAALERLHAALQETPDQPRLHAVAAAAAARLYRLEAQPAHYTAAWDHILAARRDPALAPAMLRLLADIEILAGHLPEAIPLLEAFLAARPDAIDARALLAAVHRHCGDRAAARACLKDRAETPFTIFLEIEALIQGLASPGRPTTPAVEPLTLPELPADRPWGQVYRAAYVLEALLLYWRAGFHTDVLAYLDAAIKAGQPCGLHPLAALLAMDAAAALGLEDLARRYAILAGSAVDWVVPATWEMVCLIDRARRRLPPEDHGALPLLAGAAAAENDRTDEAIELLSRAAEAPVGSARAVAARALTGTDTPELAPTREEMERIVGDVDDAHR
ncbi:MAG: DUF5107 domain-containing protein, partial [Lentisphaerae bacterium]|nr:DUF5107 domain-containing protein [Lentisphaerota bacterium]